MRRPPAAIDFNVALTAFQVLPLFVLHDSLNAPHDPLPVRFGSCLFVNP